MFRLALEADEAGVVQPGVFLGLCSEEGHVACFCPVPLPQEERHGPARQGSLGLRALSPGGFDPD